MNDKEREIMQQALEAMDMVLSCGYGSNARERAMYLGAYTVLREALDHSGEATEMVQPVKGVELTDGEIEKITGYRKVGGTWPVTVLVGLSLVAAFKEKNK